MHAGGRGLPISGLGKQNVLKAAVTSGACQLTNRPALILCNREESRLSRQDVPEMESRATLALLLCLFGFEILEGRDVRMAEVCASCVREALRSLAQTAAHKVEEQLENPGRGRQCVGGHLLQDSRNGRVARVLRYLQTGPQR